MPDGIIMEEISQLTPDNTYLIVYVRQKTDEEQSMEKEVSNGVLVVTLIIIINILIKKPILKFAF